ncbi:hypothetical protein [Streptomyces incanus]|uniref:Uncharacterized protein n=1 Tax=Streptomyces incanus TaxID=887453 RepID=A0ABW0XXZ2_9ACTN
MSPHLPYGAVPHGLHQQVVLGAAHGEVDQDALLVRPESGSRGAARGPVLAGALDLDVHLAARLRGPQLIEGTTGHAASGAHDRDPVAELLDQIQLVAGEEHGHTLCRLVAKDVAHVVDGERVEP